LEQLDKVIVAAMEQSTKLTRVVTKMKSIETSQAQHEALIKAALNLLVPSTAKDIRHNLLHINRPSDTTPDLWTQFNLIQENAVKGRIVYRLVKTDSRGTKITDHAVRSIKPNTNRDVVFNQALFDVAASLVA
jgi:hypothetical protein